MENQPRKKKKEEEEEGIYRFRGPAPPPPIPNMNFAAYILENTEAYGEETAVVEIQEDGQIGAKRSFEAILRDVPLVAGGLRDEGVQVGDKIGISAPLHADYSLAVLAVTWAGAVCVLLDPTLYPEELRRALGVSGVRWVIAAEEVYEGVKEAGRGRVRKVWMLRRRLPSSSPSLGHLLLASPIPPEAVDAPKTPAAVFFSSGTTSLPKAVLLSHGNLITHHQTPRYLLSLGGEATERAAKQAFSRCLLTLPLQHMLGFFSMLYLQKMGCCAYLLAKYSPRRFLQAIQDYKITASPLVPYVADQLAKTPFLDQYDTSSLQALASSSAALSIATRDTLYSKLGVTVSNGYGMTEAVNIASHSVPPPACPLSVGHVMPYMQIKIAEPQIPSEGGGGGGGGTLTQGEIGEVLVKSPAVMMGYIEDGKCVSCVDEDGWMRTGDLGYFDGHGCLHLVGRCKEVIKVKGYQVSPGELEEALLSVDGVEEAAVVGAPHPTTGEAPTAFVVLGDHGRHLTPHHLKTAVAERIAAPYKRLTGGVVFMDALPRTSSGKVMRGALRKLCGAPRPSAKL